MDWEPVDSWDVMERNTGEVWRVTVWQWSTNKQSHFVTATEVRSGAVTTRHVDGGVRKATKSALDLTALLGGHRSNGEWIVRASVPVKGWTTLPISRSG